MPLHRKWSIVAVSVPAISCSLSLWVHLMCYLSLWTWLQYISTKSRLLIVPSTKIQLLLGLEFSVYIHRQISGSLHGVPRGYRYRTQCQINTNPAVRSSEELRITCWANVSRCSTRRWYSWSCTVLLQSGHERQGDMQTHGGSLRYNTIWARVSSHLRLYYLPVAHDLLGSCHCEDCAKCGPSCAHGNKDIHMILSVTMCEKYISTFPFVAPKLFGKICKNYTANTFRGRVFRLNFVYRANMATDWNQIES